MEIKLSEHKKAYKVVPTNLIIIYPLFVAMDIYLTYLGTPDLKYESNLIIKAFNLDWFEIILLSFLFVTILILLIFRANKYYERSTEFGHDISRKANIVNFLVVSIFYIHFFASFFILSNNYLGIVFLYYDQNHWLKDLSIKYVGFYNLGINTFLFVVYSILTAIGSGFAFVRIKKHVENVI